MQTRNDLSVIFRRIERFVSCVEIGRGKRFQAHQQTAAAAAGRQVKERQILTKQGCRQSIPVDSEGDERLEEPRRILFVGYQVQVEKDRPPRSPLLNVGDDFFNGLLKRLSPPGVRNDAEGAAVCTAARRLEDICCEVT